MPPQDPPASPLQTPRLPLQPEDPATPPDLVYASCYAGSWRACGARSMCLMQQVCNGWASWNLTWQKGKKVYEDWEVEGG